MRKYMTSNDKNMSTQIVAARFEQNVDATEVSCKKDWKHFNHFDHFNNQKSDYDMEKINYSENILYYLNQVYLTVQKKRKLIMVIFTY